MLSSPAQAGDPVLQYFWYRCWMPALKRASEAIPDDYRAGLQIVMKQEMTFVA